MPAIFWATKFGKKILVIDNDSQANTTISLGLSENQIEKSIYHLYADDIKEANEIIYPTKYVNIDIIPATIDLQRAENNIKNNISPNEQLKNYLYDFKNECDYIIIDNGVLI